MLHLFKKRKLDTELGPERVHKAPISFQIKNLLEIICRLPAPTKVFLQL